MSDIQTKEMICSKHGAYQAKTICILGQDITMPCPECRKEEEKLRAQIEQRKAKQKEKERITYSIGKSGIPPIYRNLDNFKFRNSQKGLENYDYKTNLILYGGIGTGKTMAASYIGIKAIKQGLTVRYLYANEIDKRIKSTWGTKMTEEEAMCPLLKCDVLILDEIGRVEYSDNLFKVFDSRYTNNKPIILLGNIDVKNIPSIFGDAIASRIRSSVQAVYFGAEDLRKPIF